MAKANHNSSKPRARKPKVKPHEAIINSLRGNEKFQAIMDRYINDRLGGTELLHPDYVYEAGQPQAPTPSSQYTIPNELQSVVAEAVKFNETLSAFVDEMVGVVPATDTDGGAKFPPVNCYVSDLLFSIHTLRRLTESNQALYKRLREYL